MWRDNARVGLYIARADCSDNILERFKCNLCQAIVVESTAVGNVGDDFTRICAFLSLHSICS